MARNGSGVMSIPNPDFVALTVIESDKVDANFATIVDELTNSIAADGQTTPTANLPMGGFKLTGLGSGSSATDSVHLRDVQYQAYIWCGTAGGTADAITLSPSPAIAAYAAGQVFRWKAGASPNTTAMTADISSLGTIAIQNNGSALTGGEHAANGFYEGVLDTTGTMQLRQISGNFIGFDAQAQGAVLDDLNTLGAASSDGEIIVATGAGAFAYESGATLRTSIGVGTGDSPQFTALDIESTDAGAGAGPILSLYRNSASPDANDALGQIDFYGEDSAGNKQQYATYRVQIVDATSGSEDARHTLSTQIAGSAALPRMYVGAGVYTANATSGDQGVDTINASAVYDDGNQLSHRITTLTASTSANLTWSSIPSGAKRIIIRLRNLDPVTSDTNLVFTTTVSGTRQTGAGDYQYTAQVWQGADATATRGSTSAAEILVASGPAGFGVSNAFSGVTGTIILENPTSTSLHKHVSFHTQYIRAGSNELRTNVGSGIFESNSAVDGFDLRMSSGNIASGDVDVYVEY